MNVVITGGGTGGHIYPAIAVAQEIKKRYPEFFIKFIGTKSGAEARAVPAAGFPIEFIPAAGLSGNPVKLLKFALFNISGLIQAVSILLKTKPGLVIGSGGFVSAPVVFGAGILGIPYVILEQNAYPGKVNRFLAEGARKILASFDDSVKFFPSKKTIVTGNPVRREIVERTREEALEKLNLDGNLFTLLVTGGSQGARSFNNAVIKALPLWKDKKWQIIHLAGRKNHEEVKAATDSILKDFKGDYRCVSYLDDMASAYAAADLVVARSGASTIAEITSRGIPSILVPYPFAADNHQEKNARCVEAAGGAKVILDNQIEESLAQEVSCFAENKERLMEMAVKSGSLGKIDALDGILKELTPFLEN